LLSNINEQLHGEITATSGRKGKGKERKGSVLSATETGMPGFERQGLPERVVPVGYITAYLI
jgi:hypothetical protein